MRLFNWMSAATVLSSLAVVASGCALGGAEEEEVGEAQEAQIDPIKDYLIYDILDDSGFLKGKVLVTATSGAGYTANREYWYMTSNLSNGSAVTFDGGAGDYWSNTPSGLGTLSFVTNRTPTWTSATPSGSMLLHTNRSTGERIGINWGMSVSHGEWFGSITWWHSNTNNLFGAGTSTRLAPGTPASGTWYRYITSPL